LGGPIFISSSASRWPATECSLAWVLFIALTADGERLVESTPLSRHEAMSKEIPGDIASEDLDGSFKCRMKYRL
jgi:hypothetical protein